MRCDDAGDQSFGEESANRLLRKDGAGGRFTYPPCTQCLVMTGADMDELSR